jgi:uncharacterized protein YdhG (YjbR/CyaY superfamily)
MAERKTTKSFTDAERAAMRERNRESKRVAAGADGEADVQAKIADMTGTDRVLAEAIHALVKENAPDLTPRTYYGMPAYAKDGSVLFWFKPAAKFKARFATLGFSDKAALDDGTMWATEFALPELNADNEARIAALVKQAAG